MASSGCPPEYLAEHYNGRIFRCYCVYVAARFGVEVFESACSDLGVSGDFLTDKANWFSNTFLRRFIDLLKERTGQQDIAEQAGAVFGSPEVLSPIEYILMATTLSPFTLLRALPFHYAKFNRINKVKLLHQSPGKCIFSTTPRASLLPEKEVCESTISILSGIRHMFDLENVQVTHSRCVHEGHNECEFQVRYSAYRFWKGRFLRYIMLLGLFLFLWILIGHLPAETIHNQNEIRTGWRLFFASLFSLLPLLIIGYLKKMNLLALYFQQNVEVSKILFHERLEFSKKASRITMARQVAHDIRSPLAALEVSISDPKAPDMELIRAAIHRMKNIANYLLDSSFDNYSERQNCDVNDVIDSIVKEKKIILQRIEKNIAINFIRCGETTTVKADSVKLGAIISNLINNAFEAVSKKGIIKIRTMPEKGIVRVDIEDNGKGIPSRYISVVTNLGFSRGKRNGNGLGLSHAKSYLEEIGGRLIISSKIGLGTKISLMLPSAQLSRG